MTELDIVYNEDCLQGLKHLPDNSIECCVTSPPYYGLRQYAPDLVRLKILLRGVYAQMKRINKTSKHERQGIFDSVYN